MLSVYYIKKEIPSHQPEPPHHLSTPSPLQSQKEVMASCSTFHRVIKYRQEEKRKRNKRKKKEFSCGCFVVWKAIQE
jgi:hypothetical protein